MTKMTAAEIIYTALVWAEESMVQMISGCAETDPYRAEVTDQVKQLRTYRKRRYGVPPNPLEGAKALTLDELRKLLPSNCEAPNGSGHTTADCPGAECRRTGQCQVA